MKKNLIPVALFSILGSSYALADEQTPEQFIYQVALFDGDVELYNHEYFTTGANQSSIGDHVPYFIKTCDNDGSKITNTSGSKAFYKGIGYSIDVQTSTLKFVETVIDESSYTKPTDSEVDQCINTGQPFERKYEYKATFDLTTSEIQKFSFDNNRTVKIVVRKEDSEV